MVEGVGFGDLLKPANEGISISRPPGEKIAHFARGSMSVGILFKIERDPPPIRTALPQSA
jgi:hypothetical protein